MRPAPGRRSPSLVARVALGASLLAGLAAAPGPALAVDVEITVNTLSDSVADDGFCSLREALTAANTNIGSGATTGECGPGSGIANELIDFSVGGTITLGSDQVATTNPLTIDGGNGITINANGHRAFFLSGDPVHVRNLRITGASGGYGGAIATDGHVYLERLTISGSTAAQSGGAIFAGAGSAVLVRESTLSGNSANQAGGAVYAEGAYIGFLNVTLAGNSAASGGALYSTADVTEFLHATVSRNTAPDAGGARVTRGEVRVVNTLIIGNTTGNLVSTGATAIATGSLVNRSATGILDPSGLASNGGPTKTIRLVKGSTNPALDHGDPGWCAETSGLDQRGMVRVGGTACDTGAVELDRTVPTMTRKPRPFLLAGGTAGDTSMRVEVSWNAADTGTGIGRFTIQRQVNGGSWTTLSSSVAPEPENISASVGSIGTTGLTEARGTYRLALSAGKQYRFRVRAIDEDQNVSAWSYSSTVTTRLVQHSSSSVVFSSGWSGASSTNYSGDSVRYTATAGRTVRMTFTGRDIAFVTTYRTPKIVFDVYVDNVKVDRVEVVSSSTSYRRQAYTRPFLASAQHTIRIVVVSGRVDMDAFAVLR